MYRGFVSLLLFVLAPTAVAAEDAVVGANPAPVIAAQAFLHSRLAEFGRVELTAIGKLPETSYPGSKVSYRVAGEGRMNARMCVWADIQIDTQRRRSVPFWFGVKVYRDVRVTTHALNARQLILHSDYRVETRDVALMRNEVPSLDESLLTTRTTRAVAANSVITQRMIEPAPEVARNQTVRVRVVAGKIEIETQGVALNDGRNGEYVKIASRDGTQTYSAKVTASGRVLVNGDT